MRLLTAVGARPQFIKAAPVSRALAAAGHEEILVHSGQHHDQGMSDVFFREMGLRKADLNLGITGGAPNARTGAMLAGYEAAIEQYRPDIVLVYGDTDTTLAAALAAKEKGRLLAHVEAGLRSYNRSMPEEQNRVLTDHVADILFCPTDTALKNLHTEGLANRAVLTGDVMYDAARYYAAAAARRGYPETHALESGMYFLATLHRQYTVDDAGRLRAALDILGALPLPVLLPVHPRTKKQLRAHGLGLPPAVLPVAPLGYIDFMSALQSARMVLTDSGGVQKEAYFHGVPCITLRTETEWIETVDAGWNRVLDLDARSVHIAATTHWWPETRPALFGDGHAAERVVAVLESARELGVGSGEWRVSG
ncbi:MAG: UDP-N-acetylglucosamine 2-epimerase (non-hydrolyzing) [Ignavibacteriae bacterium]|nr:UDP-N-acetylglucosamine 2-epimerase (non-hydrolyzing) [Ignavibacteriota bacterium]